ncbi:MAG: hypothetical protein KIS88_10085 [Anaerolineales bacterium]|nr:hypothetical protein [Anaerolineales bacterium]
MDIGAVLSRAWKTVWKHKVLWIFGILASCGARSGGGSGGSGNSISTDSGQPFTPPPELQRFFTDLERSFRSVSEEQIVILAILIIGAFCLIGIISWLVGLYGKTGVTVGALRAEAGHEVSFRAIWRDSWGVFDRVVGLNILLAAPVFILALVVGIGAVFFAALTMGIGMLCLIPLLCLIIPLSLIYTVFTDMANIAVVKDGLGITAAVQRGWDVLSKNVGSIALLALILILGGLIISLILAIPFFLALVPVLLGAAQGNVGQNLTLSLICLVAVVPVTFVLGGILHSYLQTAWTLAYADLTAKR